MSYVDESLFGESQAARRRKQKLQNAGRTASQVLAQNQETAPLSLSRSTYRQMQRRALTAEEEFELQKKIAAQRAEDKRKSGPDIKWITAPRPTVQQEYDRRLREQGDGPANVRAAAMMDEELDEVKTLQHKLNIMKVKSIREQQIFERIARKEKEDKYDQHFFVEKMKERDAALYAAEQEQIRLHNRKKSYAAELTQQKLECERRKILELEAKEQEGRAMKRRIQKMVVQDEEAQKRKVEEQRRRNEVLAAANIQARKYRLIRAAEDRAEDKRIMKFLAMKNYEEEQRVARELAIKAEADREVARLRALQEKANDKRGEEDEKRAKLRQRERKLKEDAMYQKRIDDRKEMMATVIRDRDKQIRLKARDELIEKKLDKAYMARITKEQVVIEDRLQREKERKHQINIQHAKELAELRDRRKEQAKQKIVQQREVDARNAMDGDVYKLRVKEVFARKLREHQDAGHALPPEFLQKQESEEEKRKRRTKFSTSRPLW